MVEAIPAMVTEKAVTLFERFGVFTKAELESRAEIQYESYAKAINIEARTMIDMARKQFIPAVIKYTKTLADTVLAVKEAGVDASVQAETLEEITVLLKEARAALARLEEVTAQAAAKEEGPVQANFYHDEVCPAMENLRRPIDKLEMIVDKEAWPIRRSDLRSLINQRNEEKTGCDLNENRVRIFVMGGNKKYEDSSRIETACDKDRSQELSCL